MTARARAVATAKRAARRRVAERLPRIDEVVADIVAGRLRTRRQVDAALRRAVGR